MNDCKLNSIFRFRTFDSDYALNDLINDTITGVTNDHMNDPYDCHFYFNKEDIKEYITKKGCFKSLILHSKNIKLKDCDLDELVLYIAHHLEEAIELCFFTTCFTKNFNKEIMWAHYSNNATGYVVEYDMNEIMKAVNELQKQDKFNATKFGEVNYFSDKNDYTGFVKNYIDNVLKYKTNNYLDVLDVPVYKFDEHFAPIEYAKNIVFDKSKDWEYENEYRLVVPNDLHKSNGDLISTFKFSLTNIKAQAVYLGENCTLENESKIIEIAKQKNIKVFKMKRIYYEKKYFLGYDEIS